MNQSFTRLLTTDMTRFFYIAAISLLFCTWTLSDATAQKKKSPKDEEKEWKKRLKSLDPLKLRDMYEELNQLRAETSAQKGKVDKFADERQKLVQQIAERQAEVDAAQQQLAQLKQTQMAKEQEMKDAAAAKGGINKPNDDYTKGIVFKVQVGAFKQKDLASFLNQGNFWEEDDQGGSKRFTVGMFRDYWAADTFKKYLRQMGVADAWIVAYKDNARAEMRDVLQEVSAGGFGNGPASVQQP